MDCPIGDLVNEQRTLDAFDEIAKGKRHLAEGTKRANATTTASDKPTVTTAELTFRWASRAVGYCMDREKRIAVNAILGRAWRVDDRGIHDRART
ncbi:hypothetical protein IFT63_02590 [Stenotrophomonas sp. CFBP 13724]|uniref:hypothetical protein n=1 Tax=Stenotrophomonas sp. CFBP 13724 TaxID=2775298 RepID=UPI001783B0B0|nr:hypothetical protein [Stenotrophomonas sp. CFBP 13724]MBD8642476.1 hypothetical protein [Stenotrophomonas sp. CFBP 13724]